MPRDISRPELEAWLSIHCGLRWSDVECKAKATGFHQALDLVLRNLRRTEIGGPVVTTPRTNCWSGGVALSTVCKVRQRDVYFVDPDTSRLSYCPLPRVEVIRDTDTRLVVGANKQRIQAKGQWFLVTIAPIPSDRRFVDCFGLTTITACRRRYGGSFYGVSKRAVQPPKSTRQRHTNDRPRQRA